MVKNGARLENKKGDKKGALPTNKDYRQYDYEKTNE